MGEQVELLEARARGLLEKPDAWETLTERLYQNDALRHRGMTARVGSGLVDDASPMAAACAPRRRPSPISSRVPWTRARPRRHLSTSLLALVASLPEQSGAVSSSELYLDIVLRGIRTPG
jgi:hypothetical protein